jgi:hypothetical protein
VTRWLLAAVVVCGVVAAWRATAFLPALNAEQPLAAAVLPVIDDAETSGNRLARRVVLVIVDGLRHDVARGMTTMTAIGNAGLTTTARAPFPTLSMPNYVTLMTGVAPRYSGFRTNDLRGDTATVRLDSVFARARAAGLRVGYASDRETAMPDLFGNVIDDAAEAADRLANAQLAVIVMMDVDRAGHDHGGASDGYRDAASRLDVELGTIYRALDPNRDTILVTADHGHSDRGGHGGDAPAMTRVPFVMAGAGVRRGAKLGEIELVDIAPTIAALLGVQAPRHAGGSTLVNALAIERERATVLIAADARRTAVIDAAEQAVDLADEERHRNALLMCMPIVVLGFGAMLAALLIAHRRKWIRLCGTAIAIGAVFPIVYFGSAMLGERWLSEPGVPGERLSLWLEYGRYGGVAAVTLVVCHAIAMRRSRPRGAVSGKQVVQVVTDPGRRADNGKQVVQVVTDPGRRADSEGVVADAAGALVVGLATIVLVALVTWAVAGRTLATLLPSPLLVIVTPVAYMAVAWYALATICTLAMSAFVRRRYPGGG